MPYNLKSFIRKVPRIDFKGYIVSNINFDEDYLLKDKNDKYKKSDKKYIEHICSSIKNLDKEKQLSINNDCETAYIIFL